MCLNAAATTKVAVALRMACFRSCAFLFAVLLIWTTVFAHDDRDLNVTARMPKGKKGVMTTRELTSVSKNLNDLILKLRGAIWSAQVGIRQTGRLPNSRLKSLLLRLERRAKWTLVRATRRAEAQLRQVRFGITFRQSIFRTAMDNIERQPVIQRFIHRRCRSRRFRNIDGSCTNLRIVRQGAAGQPFQLLTNRGPSKAPTGQDRPSARVISNIVHHDVKETKNRRAMSEMVVFFGQLLDHTFAEFKTPKDRKKVERFFIPIPKDDKVFKNVSHIQFVRTAKKKTPRGWSAENQLPSYIDAASTYGPTRSVATQLRTLKDGLLATSSTPHSNSMMPVDDDGFFIAGDPR